MSKVQEGPGTERVTRILLVDDDESIRMMLKKILERENFVVETAKDGQEAIERLGAEDYDAVLLDLMRPRVDGFGVIDHLRSHDPATLPKVIVMTAFTVAAKERLEPACRLISKPFDIAELVTAVRSCAGV
jgi:DNA-binding response OmpR family regulator